MVDIVLALGGICQPWHYGSPQIRMVGDWHSEYKPTRNVAGFLDFIDQILIQEDSSVLQP